MPDRPNILLITGDHLNWNTICGRSICRTPNLSRIADAGLSFGRSYSAVSLCCPSRAMLLSGAYPWHNGVFNQIHVPESVHRDMFDDVQTYPQRLADAGYRLGYVGKWHASWTRGPSDFGFSVMREVGGFGPECRERLGDRLEYAPRPEAERRLVEPQYVTWPGGDRFLMWAGVETDPETLNEARLARAAVRTVNEFAGGHAPWLLEVHFPEPHDSYTPHVQFLENYPVEDVELPRSFYEETFEGKPGLLAREAACWDELSEEQFRQGLRHYYAYCEQLDHFAGRVLDALDRTGQADRTLVVLGCDHGDMVGAHHMFIKGWMPYEETHRIPMAARWPGVIPAGSVTSELVHLHDWAHTFTAARRRPPAAPPGRQGPDPAAARPGRLARPGPHHERLLRRRVPLHPAHRHRPALQVRLQRLRPRRVLRPGARPRRGAQRAGRPGLRPGRDRDARRPLGADAAHDDPYVGHRYGAGRYLPAYSKGELRRSWD